MMAAVFRNKRTGKNKVAPAQSTPEVPLVVPTESTPVYTTPPPSPCASMAPTRESTPTRGVSLATLLSVPSLMERVKEMPGTGPEVSIGDFDNEPEHPYFSVAPDAVQLRFIIHETKGEFSYEGVIASKYQGNYGDVMNPMDSDDETPASGDNEFSNIVPDTQ